MADDPKNGDVPFKGPNDQETTFHPLGGDAGWKGRSEGTNLSQKRGVYAKYPGITPKYYGQDTSLDDLKVARIYLSGLDITSLSPNDSRSAAAFGADSLKSLFKKGYVGFFLSQVTEQHLERVEVVPLPGGSFQSYFFGESPSTYVFDGMFLNTRQNQWRMLWSKLYQHVLRGSQVAGHRKLVQIAYDSKIVSGYITGYTDNLRAENELFSRFQFSMLVVQVDDGLPQSELLQSADPFLGDATDFANYAKIITGDLSAVRDYSDTAFIAPPPRPRPSGKGKAKTNCRKPPKRNSRGANNNVTGGASDSVVGRKCAATREIARLRKNLSKAKARRNLIAQAKARAEAGLPLTGKYKEFAGKSVSDIEKMREDHAKNTLNPAGKALDAAELKSEVGNLVKDAQATRSQAEKEGVLAPEGRVLTGQELAAQEEQQADWLPGLPVPGMGGDYLRSTLAGARAANAEKTQADLTERSETIQGRITGIERKAAAEQRPLSATEEQAREQLKTEKEKLDSGAVQARRIANYNKTVAEQDRSTGSAAVHVQNGEQFAIADLDGQQRERNRQAAEDAKAEEQRQREQEARDAEMLDEDDQLGHEYGSYAQHNALDGEDDDGAGGAGGAQGQ